MVNCLWFLQFFLQTTNCFYRNNSSNRYIVWKSISYNTQENIDDYTHEVDIIFCQNI